MHSKKAYIYNDGGYEFLSLHRKVMVYDPRNTDNLLILDYFNTIKAARDTSSVYHKLVEIEMEKYKNPLMPSIPISFQMVYHEINMAWVDIIHQMLFIDEAFETFCAQYGNIIKKIITHKSISDKESLVYRYYGTGETIFHIAGKLWILNKCHEKMMEDRYIGNDVYRFSKHVLTCYEKISDIVFNGKSLNIVYSTDFKGTTILNYLQNYADMLKENNFNQF